MTTQPQQTQPALEGSVFRQVWDGVKGVTVNNFLRVLSVPISAAFWFFGRGPIFRADSRAYQNPIFDGVFTVAPPHVWGVAFWLCAALMLLTVVTGRAAIYAIAVILSGGVLGVWIGLILYEADRSEAAVLTDGAIGYFIFALTCIIGMAFSPNQMKIERPIVAVTDDDHVIPLRRTG